MCLGITLENMPAAVGRRAGSNEQRAGERALREHRGRIPQFAGVAAAPTTRVPNDSPFQLLFYPFRNPPIVRLRHPPLLGKHTQAATQRLRNHAQL